MSDPVVDAVNTAKAAVQTEVKSVRQKVVDYVRANAFKASGASAVVGYAVNQFGVIGAVVKHLF